MLLWRCGANIGLGLTQLTLIGGAHRASTPTAPTHQATSSLEQKRLPKRTEQRSRYYADILPSRGHICSTLTGRISLNRIVMTVPKIPEWRKLPLSLTELSINTTLQCGQSFRWKKTNDEWFVCCHVRNFFPGLTFLEVLHASRAAFDPETGLISSSLPGPLAPGSGQGRRQSSCFGTSNRRYGGPPEALSQLE
ncbi:hypothetical protein IMZ48_04490, partial [Candidatus Bathyarchaeota archaeon]|nr:hypothetical protein [Candidatus Bathyarchaeota archaeon]